MHAKQIKLSLLILFGLIVLSYGFLISAQENSASSANIFTDESSGSAPNLTTTVAQKIAALTDGDAQQVSLEEIQSIVEGSLSSQKNEISLPEISRDELNIKKQDYSKYSEAIAKEKEKNDAIAYTAGVFYVFNSNSVEPVNSISEVPAFFSSLTNTMTSVIATGDTTSLNSLTDSSKKIFEQLKDVEVPEKLVDTHIKLMQFTQYATNMKTMLASQNSDDPLAALSNLSQVSGFIETAFGSLMEISQTFKDYIPEDDPLMASQLEKYGIEIGQPVPAETETENN